MSYQDHYGLLGLGRTASLGVIRSAYRSLSQRWHPDRHPQGDYTSLEMMKRLNNAYRVLSDPELRAAYDEELEGRICGSPPSDKPSQKAKERGRSPNALLNMAGTLLFALCVIGAIKAAWDTSAGTTAGVLIALGLASLICWHLRNRTSVECSHSGEDLSKHSLTRAPRPWVRLLARMLDLQLALASTLVLMTAFEPITLRGYQTVAASSVLACALWLGVEVVLLSRYGTTPGKWLLGIRVFHHSRRAPGTSAWLARSARVWMYGIAMGLPFIWVIACATAYISLTKRGKTLWDQRGGFEVEHAKFRVMRTLGCAVMLLFFIALNSFFLQVRAQEVPLQRPSQSAIIDPYLQP